MMTFNEFWDSDIDDTGNPYRKDSPAYWAWQGWQAGVKAERERCAKLLERTGNDHCAAAIRAPQPEKEG